MGKQRLRRAALPAPLTQHKYFNESGFLMIRILLLAGISCLARAVPAQNLSPSLIGSAFAHAIDPGFGTLDWSVGETVVSTYAPAAGPVLTQGFHQVFVSLVTDAPDVADDPFLPLVYPNPGNEWVNVETTEDVRVRLLSLSGAELLPFDESAAFHTFALGHLPSGTYLLEIERREHRAATFFKLQIIH